MIARNDTPNDRLQPDLQSVVTPDTFDFSWVKPREQDFCITRSGGGLCASTGFADSNERREGTGSSKSAGYQGPPSNVCQLQTKEYDR